MADDKKTHSCCDDIVQTMTRVGNSEGKIVNLEKLYTPVSRLTVLFCICIFVLVNVFALTGYVLTRVDTIRELLATSQNQSGLIEKDIDYIKKSIDESRARYEARRLAREAKNER